MSFFGDTDDIPEHSHIEHDDSSHTDKKNFEEQIAKDRETVKIERQCLTSKNSSDRVKENKGVNNG